MKKLKLQIVAAFMALALVMCLTSCSEPQGSHRNDQSALWCTIDCEYAGASAEEVVSLVSYPLETTLSTIAHVKSVSSVSRSSRATIWVEFEPGVDLYEGRQAVAQRLKVAASSLPDGATPTLSPPLSDEALLIALYSQSVPEAAEKQIELAGQLRDLAEYSLRPRLLTVSGVSGVTVIGGLRKQYEVAASQERLVQVNVTLEDLANAIEKANAAVTGRDLIAEREVLIRSVGQLQSLEELSDTVIVTKGDRTVRVKDVADVNIGWVNEDDCEDHVQKNRELERFGGVILAIQITPSADQQAVSKKIDETLKQLQNDLPNSVKIARNVDQRFDGLVKLTMQKLGRQRPPGWEYQRRSTKQLGDHLVAGKPDRVVMKLIGPDLTVLRGKADEVLKRLREVSGVTDLQIEPRADIPQLRVEIDREASARHGLSSFSVAQALGLAISGKVVTQVREGKHPIDVFVKAQPVGDDQTDMKRCFTRTVTGELVPLNQLAELKAEAVPPVVYCENLQPVVFVSCRVTGRDKSDVQADVQKALDSLKQSPDRVEGDFRIEYLNP